MYDIFVLSPSSAKRLYRLLTVKENMETMRFVYKCEFLYGKFKKHFETLGYSVSRNSNKNFFIVLSVNVHQKEIKFYSAFRYGAGNNVLFIDDYDVVCNHGIKVVDEDLKNSIYKGWRTFFE